MNEYIHIYIHSFILNDCLTHYIHKLNPPMQIQEILIF